VVKVQKGETLWAIAVREYGPKVGPRMVGAIADANPKVRPEALKTGTELSLPAPEGGVVEPKPQQKPQPARKTDAPGDAGKGPTESTTKPPARKLPFVPAGS
jgi:LysM repeat protein